MAEVTHVGFVKRGGLKANNVIDGTFYSLREETGQQPKIRK